MRHVAVDKVLESARAKSTVILLGSEFTKRQIVQALADLQFDRSNGFVVSLLIDADVRDLLLQALQRP